MLTVTRTTFVPRIAPVDFWNWAIIVSPMFALFATWCFSSYFHALDGLYWVGEQMTPLQAFVISLYMASPFAACLYSIGEWNLALARLTKSWPTTLCLIYSSEIVEGHGYRRGPLYRLKIDYRYTVDGIAHVGDRVQFGSKWLADKELLYQLAKRFPAGAEVKVHYDPRDPASAVLDTSDEVAAKYATDYRTRVFILLGTIIALPLVSFVVIQFS